MRLVVILALLTGVAHAQPRVRSFIRTPGIGLGAHIVAAGFCNASQRAVLRLINGDIFTIDAAGSAQKLANVGPMSTGPIACDSKNRLLLAANRKLIAVDANGSSIVSITTTDDVREIKLLDDDTFATLSAQGAVARWDGSKLVDQWTAKTFLPRDGNELDGRGEHFLAISVSRATIFDNTGKKTSGPTAIAATWHGKDAILFTDRKGDAYRWKIGTPDDAAVKIDSVPQTFVFPRLNVHSNGKRFVFERHDGPLVSLELDANGNVKQRALLSRIPSGARQFAMGNSSFAVIGVGDRAHVVDLTKSAATVDYSRPLGPVTSMAFSPDGRSLAMLGGDKDILVASFDTTQVLRLVATQMLRQPMRWLADGTIFVFGIGNQHLRFNPDGTTEIGKVRTVGLTQHGEPITIGRDRKVTIERGGIAQTFEAKDGVNDAEASDRYIAIRSFKRIDVFSIDALPNAKPLLQTNTKAFVRGGGLVGNDAGVMYVDELGKLVLATRAGERDLTKIEGFTIMSISSDRRRIAVGSKTALSIWDEFGNRIADVTPSGTIHSLAWSPDLRTLAVATHVGVELWTIPR